MPLSKDWGTRSKPAVSRGGAAHAVSTRRFVDAVREDAVVAQGAIGLVLDAPALGSLLVDNLNATIHLRALLTDLFLIDQARGTGDSPRFLANGGRNCRGSARAFRGLTRSAPSRSRALRKFPDGSFGWSLVGSLRALTSAKIGDRRGIAAARIGFLLAALHSVAERVNPRKARPPAAHGPRVLATQRVPICRCWQKSARLSGHGQNQNSEFWPTHSTLGDAARCL